MSLDPLVVFLGMAVARSITVELSIAAIQPCMVSSAQLRCRLDEGIQHRLQIECGAADDLEYVGGGSLLLEGFAQFRRRPSTRPIRRGP